MEEFSMAQSILQIVSEKGFDGLREILEGVFFQRVFLIPYSQNRSSGCILQNYHSVLT